MTIFVQDTFTDSNGTLLQDHTPEIGFDWEVESVVNAEIQSNQLVRETTASPYYRNLETPPEAEYDITAHFTPTSSTQNFALLWARNPDDDNGYFFRFGNDQAANKHAIFKKIATVFTMLDFLDESLTEDVEVLFLFEIRDGEKRCLTDGVEKVTTADNELTAAGLVGISVGQSSQFNDFQAETLIAEVPSISAISVVAATDVINVLDRMDGY